MLLLVALWPAQAAATPVSGKRQTVEMTFTTTASGAASGFLYRASFRNPENPSADPPPLRRLVIEAPTGAKLDTAVPSLCPASDQELKEKGDGACPSSSRIGSGTADIKPTLFPAISYTSAFFNDVNEQVELFTADPPSPPVVVHGFIRGNILDSPVPTCLNGGFAPRDCPSDQVSLLGNTVDIPIYTKGDGARRRSYFTTPRTCPASRRWRSPITFYYGDGAVERLVTEQPCVRPRLALSVRRGTARAARKARVLRLSVRVAGLERTVRVRAALRRVGSGRILGRARGGALVRETRSIAIRLRRRGLSPGRYEVAARARGTRRVVLRFKVR
jgi:hypothetical protein